MVFTVRADPIQSLSLKGGVTAMEKHNIICQWMKELQTLMDLDLSSISMNERKWDQESNQRQVEGVQLHRSKATEMTI
jgi:hypothetical protein